MPKDVLAKREEVKLVAKPGTTPQQQLNLNLLQLHHFVLKRLSTLPEGAALSIKVENANPAYALFYGEYLNGLGGLGRIKENKREGNVFKFSIRKGKLTTAQKLSMARQLEKMETTLKEIGLG